MYIWVILKLLIYLPFCFKKFGLSEPDEVEEVLFSPKIPITLRLDGKSIENHYIYKTVDDTGIYVADDKIEFSSVILPSSCSKPDIRIWETRDSDEYANEVVVFGIDSTPECVRISLVDGNKKHFYKDELGVWKEFDINKKLIIKFFINTLHQPHSHQHFDGDIRVYKAKDYCAYNEVSQKTRKNILTIWKSKNDNEFANKIVLNGALDSEKINKLSIFLENGSIIHYIKRENKWIITTSHICLNIFRKYSTFEFVYYKDGDYEIYKPKFDFIFVKVLLGHSLIWRSKNESEFVKKVMLDIDPRKYIPNSVILFFVNGLIKHFMLMYSKWTEIKPVAVLDISKKESTSDYKYIKNEKNVEYFIANGNLLFKGVKSTEGLVSKFVNEIWNAKTRMDYAKSVLIVPSGKEKYLVILLNKNRYLIFFKSEFIKTWTNYTNNQYALGELKLLGFDLTKQKPYYEEVRPQEMVPIEPEKYVPEQVDITELRTKNLIDLDISKMFNIYGYKISYGENKMIFKSSFQYLFNSVKNGKEILWQPKNDGKYPYKVIYKQINDQPKVKVYFSDETITPVRKPSPMTQFNPSDVRVDVVNYKRGDKVIEGELSHKPKVKI